MHKGTLFPDLTEAQAKEIALLSRKNGSVSAAEFRRIASGSSKSSRKKEKIPFGFVCSISSPASSEIRIMFKGRHYSKNDINSWSLRKRLAYKKAIKKAFADAVVLQKGCIPPRPFERVEIEVISTLRRSRDDDSQQETAKIMRDCCITYGVIADDSRKVVLRTDHVEKIGTEYSMELVIQSR